MRTIKTFLLLVSIVCAYAMQAQVVYTEPAVLQQSTQGITVYFDATKGSAGLKDNAGPIYAHTGVITNLSTSGSDWKYAPTKWGDNSDKYLLTKVSTNLWKLQIGDIRTYYGVPAGEIVKKLAFVFRNSDGTVTGKDIGDADIFVDVLSDGLDMTFTSNSASNVVTDANSTITFTATTTVAADINIYVNSITSTPIASATGQTSLQASYNVPQGDYEVIAKAVQDDKTVLDTLSVCHRSNSVASDYQGTLKQGATVNADGSVTFCLYAPNKTNVMLVGEWDNYRFKTANMMNYSGNRYFWLTVPAGTLDMSKQYGYYYLVDDNISVADPYATMVLDPWSDKYINQNSTIYPNLKPFPSSRVQNTMLAVFQGKEDAYNWQVKDFKGVSKENLLIYEMLFRDFTTEQSVDAATAKLDYLKSLGVNAVELMPIMEFDGNNSWGYNPNFYFAPDKAYGDKTAYKRFIDGCHQRGIAVILDVVFNHTWGLHPWCKLYWDSTNNRPAADNPFYNAVAPHNYSVGNDWKQESTDVQNYFCDVLKYWINEYKVDGYRFDLAKGLGTTSSYASDYEGSQYNSARIGVLKKYTDAIKSANPNAYAIYEYFVATAEENEMGNYGGMSWHKMVDPYAQAAIGYSSNSGFNGMYTGDEGRPFGSTVGYMQSHDEIRIAWKQTVYGLSLLKNSLEKRMDRLGANAAFSLLVPGAKMLWEFEEMGLDAEKVNTDPVAPKWEYLDDQYRKGLHDSYAQLMAIRNANPDMFSSSAEFYWNATTSNWADGRFITIRNRATGKQLVAAYNPTQVDKQFSYTFDNPSGTYYINSKSYGTNPSLDAAAGTITIPANSYVVITNMQDPTGINDAIADDAAARVSIFPNPTTGYMQVNASGVSRIEVYSLAGSLVASAANVNVMNLGSLSQGTYLVKIYLPEGVQTSKLIKK